MINLSREFAELKRSLEIEQADQSSVSFTGQGLEAPSSFEVEAAAQLSCAAAALAACELGVLRGQAGRQISVDSRAVVHECSGWFSVDGKTPELWDRFAGVYEASDGYVRLHTNFTHHRDGALALLGLDASCEKSEVAQALSKWRALDYEAAAAERGLVVTALRAQADWDASVQGQAVAALDLLQTQTLGSADPIALSALGTNDKPLAGIRVLDLTRILAGPTCGRVLACYGAQVMLVNSPQLPNIDNVAETSRGKWSVHLDLRSSAGREQLRALVREAHVVVEGYRPGGLASLGFGPEELAQLRPGIVSMSLSAYGHSGPWAMRRGFDSLTQTAMGFNAAEGLAYAAAQAGAAAYAPRAMPFQVLDYASGFLMAAAAAQLVRRQQLQGGSVHGRIALARTALWLRGMGQRPFSGVSSDRAPYVETELSPWGQLSAIRHAPCFDGQPWRAERPSPRVGSDEPRWPQA